MADAGPFDLTAAIAGWRARASAQPAIDGQTLDELESHLRDGVERLESARLTTEEAFIIAARRLGTPEGVGREFARLQPEAVWLDRALWALVAVIVWGPISGLFMNVSVASAASFISSGLFTSTAVFLFAQTIGFTASLALSVWLIVSRGPEFVDWLAERSHRGWALAGLTLGLALFVLSVKLAGRAVFLFVGGTTDWVEPFGLSQPFVQSLQMLCLVSTLLLLARRRRQVARY